MQGLNQRVRLSVNWDHSRPIRRPYEGYAESMKTTGIRPGHYLAVHAIRAIVPQLRVGIPGPNSLTRKAMNCKPRRKSVTVRTRQASLLDARRILKLPPGATCGISNSPATLRTEMSPRAWFVESLKFPETARRDSTAALPESSE